MMEVIDISMDMKGYDDVVALQQEAFPPEECYSMEEILSYAESDHIFYRSFWEDGALCGLTFYDVRDSFVYLFYLAIHADFRSRGLGRKALCWLRETYPGKEIVCNIEAVGEGAENEVQRVRRLNFYEKNGFVKIPIQLYDDTGLYDILSTSADFDAAEYRATISELGFDDYHPVIITL